MWIWLLLFCCSIVLRKGYLILYDSLWISLGVWDRANITVYCSILQYCSWKQCCTLQSVRDLVRGVEVRRLRRFIARLMFHRVNFVKVLGNHWARQLIHTVFTDYCTLMRMSGKVCVENEWVSNKAIRERKVRNYPLGSWIIYLGVQITKNIRVLTGVQKTLLYIRHFYMYISVLSSQRIQNNHRLSCLNWNTSFKSYHCIKKKSEGRSPTESAQEIL